MQLQRQLGVFGATMMGLGSILGTGVFVSIGIAAGISGPAVILAIAIGAVVATCNGLNSAQLAANHPVSGGTYEYGYRYLNAPLGFTAGWMFLLAKSASAATAALGFSGYFIDALNIDSSLRIPLALAAVILLTLIVLGGIRRSNSANIVIVSITLFTLGFFVIFGLITALQNPATHFEPFFISTDQPLDVIQSILHASALMFVAYTGYGRIATMGEEVHDPRRVIPRAIITALVFTMILYISVAIVGVAVIGADGLSAATDANAAPLEVTAQRFSLGISPQIISIGAVTAMLGVLLNLILGLSRVLLAMGRRRDMPAAVARIDASGSTPYVAVIVMGTFIAALVLIGDVRTTWTFSAFNVLIYYAITNLAALRLKPEERLFPAWVAVLGLAFCLFLAFWVERDIWLLGLVLIAGGLVWHFIAQRMTRRTVEGA
ncbi:MAG: APC family permease [Anaerolineae bacterium]